MYLPKIVRYILSGGTAAFTNLFILFILVHFLRIHYLLASAVAFSLAIIVSFTLHKFWTFENKDLARAHFQFGMYLITALANLAVNLFLMYIFVEWLGFWYLYAQLFAGAMIAVASYFSYQAFVFTTQKTT